MHKNVNLFGMNLVRESIFGIKFTKNAPENIFFAPIHFVAFRKVKKIEFGVNNNIKIALESLF